MPQAATLIQSLDIPSVAHRRIAAKIYHGERLNFSEGVFLYEECSLNFLQELANFVREKFHAQKTFFNRNFHIEPTNLCIYDCKFCSYSRELKNKEESWYLTESEIVDRVKSYDGQAVTEVHIVGGVHPKLNLEFFGDVLKKIKAHRPEIHIKAFTAVELFYMFKLSKKSIRDGLAYLKSCGLDSIPGGGAEIFAEAVREKICADKCTSAQWLEIHETAHMLGIPSNATMLYGHIESFDDRIDHLTRLRDVQDRTSGFQTFIPLKFRNKNNQMADIPEVSEVEDLRNYAVSRLFLDNIFHLKAYWPMIGRVTAQKSLRYGVDDLDGTIDDSTKIYTMAGAEEQRPTLSTGELVELIREAGRKPVERDTLYNVVKDYSALAAAV